MVRVLKRTMVLDILVLSPTLGRFEVAKVVDDLSCEDFVVKSEQFMPGKRLHVIFDGPEAKNAAEQFKQATINGVTYRVVESCPQVLLVNVYHYPYEQDNAPPAGCAWWVLRSVGYPLSMLYFIGEVLHWEPTCTDGAQKKHIPRSLNVTGYANKMYSVGQPTECGICREALIAKNCPYRGKRRRCMQEGHMARDCTNPPNVWGTTGANAASDASSDVSGMDASAAEEVPGPPQLLLVAGHRKLICTIANVFLPLKLLETAPSSLRHSFSLALVTLLDLRQYLHLALMTLWSTRHVVQPALKLMMLMIQVVEAKVKVQWRF